MTLMEKLKQMKNRPSYILLENVVGFEESSVHDDIIAILNELGYGTKECILSPLQFGVPNSRPRYYLIASKHFPSRGFAEDITEHFQEGPSKEPKEIRDFIDESLRTPSLFLDKDIVQKYGAALDIVVPNSRRSACFTKSYGSYISGCGSYFCGRPDLVSNNRLTQESLNDLESLVNIVRRLSPREVANLMCFPKDFEVPPESSDRQAYQCLGNSVNVRVVAAVLRVLLENQ
ncbi:C-5 cytosine-specific DNA methylase [Oesophagostomum dentatum]|uniref:tRNA (cytosine(38)-C(5))-methyltransferase n=1 Tax=Oesophagostomum dentatum TaxID=61180 RepID=A0A0B1S4G9_OESDE|nr:C-5 cytosine-specific DNA methylase [Oesophagostomum dentatum]